MNHVTISNSYPPISPENIAQVEQYLELTLPEGYRSFLLRHNGGEPTPDAFPISGNHLNTHGLVQIFHGISDGEYFDLRRQVQVFTDRLPSDFLPIGHSPGGNLICLSVTGPNRGKVYLWDHEEEVAEGEEPDYENVYFIANSFDEFLNSLQEFPE